MKPNFTLPVQPEMAGIQPPMVYVREKLTWEYKQLTRRLDDEPVLSEEELNTLGAEGWELAGVLTDSAVVHFYFKRLQS